LILTLFNFVFSFSPADNPSVGTLFIYSHGTACSDGPERKTNVILRCKEDVDGEIVSVHEDSCEYFMYVDTKYACPTDTPIPPTESSSEPNNFESGGGLSAGSVLLIMYHFFLFFCSLFL
jgi:hypothetical protein